MKLEQAIRAAREAAGLTQEQAARKLRTNQARVSDWERGRFAANVETLRRLGRVYRCSFLITTRGVDLVPFDSVPAKKKAQKRTKVA